jgi:hypothetical protein
VPKRNWGSLSPAYQRRLSRGGITPEAYNAGASLKSARGHAKTPEHPSEAFRNPDRFGKYLRRKHAKGHELPPNLIPEQLPEFRPPGIAEDSPRLPSSLGHPGKFSFDIITFYRTKGGVQSHNRNVMVHTHYNPNGDITEHAFEYDESEFYELVRMAKDRGFTTTVESGQGDVRIVA